MPTWVKFNETSKRWEYSTNQGSSWNELAMGFRATDGSVGAPSIAFDQDPTTGIYRPSAGAFRIVTAGKYGFAQAYIAGSPDRTRFTFYAPIGAAYSLIDVYDGSYTLFTNSGGHLYVRSDGSYTLRLGVGSDRWIISTAALFPAADVTYDIGTGSYRVKDIYVAGRVQASLYGVRAYHNAAITVNTGGAVLIPLNSEQYDTHGFHSNSSNNSRLIVPTGGAGYYHVHGVVRWAAGTAGTSRQVFLERNTAGSDSSYNRFADVTTHMAMSAIWVAEINATVYLSEGDYVEMFVATGENTTIQAVTTYYYPYPALSMQRLGI